MLFNNLYTSWQYQQYFKIMYRKSLQLNMFIPFIPFHSQSLRGQMRQNTSCQKTVWRAKLFCILRPLLSNDFLENLITYHNEILENEYQVIIFKNGYTAFWMKFFNYFWHKDCWTQDNITAAWRAETLLWVKCYTHTHTHALWMRGVRAGQWTVFCFTVTTFDMACDIHGNRQAHSAQTWACKCIHCF